MPPMTQHDFLNPLFSLHPIVVALIIWFTGWGSLLLIARRTNSVTTLLLKHPGFMTGDFLMLPLAGFLITYFYQSTQIAPITSMKFTYLGVIVATLFTLTVTLYSIFISKNYHGILSIPHTIFTWGFVYIFSGFISRGFIQLLSNSTPFLWAIYIGVLLTVSAHIILKIPVIFGPATFSIT